MPWTEAQECAMGLTGRDLLVTAAAGSGKTATLTERIIRSLTAENKADRRDVSRMLIVTFTRAAAAELRARISKELSKAIATCEDSPLRSHLNDQLLKLGSAQISTIDSFYQETVRANFERLGLPAGFRLVEDTELLPLKEQLLMRIVEEGYRTAATREIDPDAPLDSIEGNTFALAMDDLVANRDRGDLANILLKIYDRLLTYPDELKLLSDSADRMEREAALPITKTGEGKAFLRIYLPALRTMCDTLREASAGLVSTKAEKNLPLFLEELAAAEAVIRALEADEWDKARALVLAYSPSGKLASVSAKDAPKDYDACKKARTDIKDVLSDKLRKFMEHDEQECARRMKRTAQTQRLLYDILTRFDAAIDKEKRRRAAFEFVDIRRFMLRLLEDENGEPTDVARALCARFDAVYIDEYQDVDAVQDRIFSLVGAGGKRFMVGDIKQSIYGFRGSDPSLFKGYKATFPAVRSVDDPHLSPYGNRIAMAKNFRCDRSVIQFTNDVCRYIFEVCPDSLAYLPAEDDLDKGKDDAQCLNVPARVVLLEDPSGAQKAAPDGTLDAEALYVAAEIARLIRTGRVAKTNEPIHPRDIAILVRAEKGAEQLVKALERYNIPTTFAPRVNLAAHPEMTMMVNLLSVIDNPHDDIPLMGLFASDGSPITLADILTVRDKKGAGSLYDDLKATAAHEPCPLREPTQRALNAFFEQLDEWRSLAATLPADKLLRHIYAHPSLAPHANSPALLSIYDHARTFQSASFCGLYQFLLYFRRVLENPSGLSAAGLKEQEDAVKIMTIHKSKGLEFPVVFLYNSSKQFNRMDENAAIVFDRELGVATKQYDPETASMTSTLSRAVITRRIREQSREEEMRILYVALTRAREQLYVTATVGKDALKKSDLPTRGNRYAILSASNSLAWLLGALASSNRRAPLDPSIVDITTLDVATILADADATVLTKPEPTETAEQPEASEDKAAVKLASDTAFYRSVLEQHRTYIDPHAAIRRLPTKAAASKLRVAILDEVWLPEEFGSDTDGQKPRDGTAASDTVAYVQSRIELMQRASRPFEELLRDSGRASAAERGTATHLFLQHCDFARLAREGVDAELTQLCKSGRLPGHAADIVRREQLAAFCQSELFTLVTQPACRSWRELHFDRFIPYARLTRNQALAKKLEDYKLYVQGSLDLLVKDENGALWLCDYKTDRIHAEDEDGIREQLLASHADQLRIYAEAVGGLFGRRPDHILIYSLPLGRSIELTQYL